MKPILEILIPTFKRPSSASAAIDSILACNDSRLTIRCNSNGYENDLEKYRNLNNRVHYDFFKSNKGPNANILKLLSETEADFCMLLSDEDRVDINNYKYILDFLENLDEGVNVIACSVYDSIKDNYMWKPSSSFSDHNINHYVAISPLSTYMSGIIFRVKPLKDINITSLLRSTIGNSYSHLDITLNLLLNGTLSFFHEKFVIKGDDIKFGGDGYRHKTKESLNKSFKTKNKDLNPDVYGPKARARQFYYRENLLNNLKKNIDFFSICIGKLNHIDFFFRSIMRSNMLVILPENTILKNEALDGYKESKEDNEYSGSMASYFFTLLLRLPKYISKPLFYITSTLNKLIRKMYAAFLFFQKNYKN